MISANRLRQCGPSITHSAFRIPQRMFIFSTSACCISDSACHSLSAFRMHLRKSFNFIMILTLKNPEDHRQMGNLYAEFPQPHTDSTIGDSNFCSLSFYCVVRSGNLSFYSLCFGLIQNLKAATKYRLKERSTTKCWCSL